MDHQALAAQLIVDEGSRLQAYIDRAGGLTVGVGHRVQPTDQLGADGHIRAARSAALLQADIRAALQLCERLWPQFDTFPDEAQQILANLAFNLGNRLRRFRRLRAAVAQQDWGAAAGAMQQSRWARQVGARSTRLITRLRALAPHPAEPRR